MDGDLDQLSADTAAVVNQMLLGAATALAAGDTQPLEDAADKAVDGPFAWFDVLAWSGAYMVNQAAERGVCWSPVPGADEDFRAVLTTLGELREAVAVGDNDAANRALFALNTDDPARTRRRRRALIAQMIIVMSFALNPDPRV